jgi:Uma2 family endonuclease
MRYDDAMGFSHPGLADRDDSPTEDHVVHLRGATWADYERLLSIRGERSAPRITFDDGLLEIMSPSRSHENLKSLIGRLVEVYCLAKGNRFTTLGSWTLKDETRKIGAEPDECYVFGDGSGDRPDLAIEVEWTSGRVDKLAVYRKLGVAEIWYFRKGALQPYVLQRGRYVAVQKSAALPDLDLALLVSFLDQPTTFDAIEAYRMALQQTG